LTTGRFFQIDRRLWADACSLGIGPAVAFLVLARGTLSDNRTTSWSVHSIEKYTNISRPRARQHVEQLIEGKIISGLVSSTTRPRYEIAGNLEPDWIWLPNSLVDGAKGEISPVELLRQAQNLDAVKLLPNLYYAQALDVDGGIEWRPGKGLRLNYSKEKLFEHGRHVVWGFREDTAKVGQGASFVIDHFGRDKPTPERWKRFWDALEVLIDAGLLEYVPHLVDANSPEAEIIYPLPCFCGEPEEQEVGKAALSAATAMLPDWLIKKIAGSTEKEHSMIAPVERHRKSVELVGIARLRYRPHTSKTGAWIDQMAEWEKHKLAFQEIEAKVSNKASQINQMQYQ
jgi:hypothetical protein